MPVLVMSAGQGWLNGQIAVTGALLILTAIGVLVFGPAASRPRGQAGEGMEADGEPSRDPHESRMAP
jgi:hypothetical protein